MDGIPIRNPNTRCSQCRCGVELRPCISFAIVQYHCSAPAPEPDVLGSARIAGSAVPAQRDSISTRITAEQRHPVRGAGINGFKNHQFVQLHKKRIGHPGTRTEADAFFEKSKKRNANPKACESRICLMPPRSARTFASSLR